MITSIITYLLVNALALWVVDFLLSGVVIGGSWMGILLAAAVFGLVNTFLKPILKFLSLPFIFVSFGLFLILINAGLLWLTVQVFDYAILQMGWHTLTFSVSHWSDYILAGIIIGVTNTLINWFFKLK